MSGPMGRHWQPEARPQTRNPPPTAAEPGHHRRQEDTFSSIRFFEKSPFYLVSSRSHFIFQETVLIFEKPPFLFILFSRSRY
jgi:hypothetical protein